MSIEIIQKYFSKLDQFRHGLKKYVKNNNEIHVELDDSFQLIEFCEFLKSEIYLKLLTIIYCDERKTNHTFSIRYLLGSDIDDVFLFVIVSIDKKHAYFPSLSDVFPSSTKYEREINDMFGIQSQENSNLKPLILHDFPENLFPLRKDFDANTKLNYTPKKFEFTPVTGDGVCEIPVGPIHAGIIEPGHFRFSVLGERIVNLETRFGYTHKGTEKIAENMSLDDAVFLSERISGDECVANSMAFCQAIEKIAQLEISEKAKQIRLVFAELERIYNHFGTLAGILTDIGFSYDASRLNILKEYMMQLNEKLSGSRILFGINQIGGVKIDMSNESLSEIHSVLNHIFQNFEKILKHIQSNSSVMDRLRNTGIINKKTVRDLGIVGISSICAGIDTDTRKIHPYGYYSSIKFEQTPTENMEQQVKLQKQIGDVLSRFLSRVDELRYSKKLIDSMCNLDDDEICIPLKSELPPFSSGLGYTESHRGETLHWVMMGENNSIFRYKIRTASFANWPIIEHAVLNNIVPDFPVINKSFDFSYSGNDL